MGPTFLSGKSLSQEQVQKLLKSTIISCSMPSCRFPGSSPVLGGQAQEGFNMLYNLKLDSLQSTQAILLLKQTRHG